MSEKNRNSKVGCIYPTKGPNSKSGNPGAMKDAAKFPPKKPAWKITGQVKSGGNGK